MSAFMRRLFNAVRRVFPHCVAQSQAIAFNMFLASFPMLLLMLGVVAASVRLRFGLIAIVAHLRPVLPATSARVVSAFLIRRDSNAWQWISLGLGGTLIAGAQMMRLIIDGFHMAYGERPSLRFWNHNLRAILLLCTTIAPWFVTAGLIVFGKQLRNWMIHQSGMPILVSALWSGLYVTVVLVLAMLVLAAIYRVGRPGAGGWDAVLPGAAGATILWWLVSSAFGLYVRHVPYGAMYGGLAAAIGLMLWMQLTSMIILLGAAYNAESARWRAKMAGAAGHNAAQNAGRAVEDASGAGSVMGTGTGAGSSASDAGGAGATGSNAGNAEAGAGAADGRLVRDTRVRAR
jgi:membrane protein